MNKKSKPIYIKISPTSPALPQTIDGELTDEQEQDLLAKCPTIHLSAQTTYEQINDFLVELFAYYFELPKSQITPESDLIDQIERLVWARELGVPFEQVTYGRIFCSTDNDGNAVGGVEDRGMMIATMLMCDFSSLVGIEVVDSPANATIIGRDDEFGNYLDCKTISDLADLTYSVCQAIARA